MLGVRSLNNYIFARYYKKTLKYLVDFQQVPLQVLLLAFGKEEVQPFKMQMEQ